MARQIRWDFATIVTTAPLTAFYEGDSASDAVPITHVHPSVSGLSAGSRVLVHFYDRVAVIMMKW